MKQQIFIERGNEENLRIMERRDTIEIYEGVSSGKSLNQQKKIIVILFQSFPFFLTDLSA